VRLRVERPCRGRLAKVRDRLRVAPLSGEGDPEVERRVRIIGAARQNVAKLPLGVSERFLLKVLPAVTECGVDRRHRRHREGTRGRRLPRQQREKFAEVHGDQRAW
jgi:hypothetical protein